MSFSFLVIEISIKLLDIKYCTFIELVIEHFILRQGRPGFLGIRYSGGF